MRDTYNVSFLSKYFLQTRRNFALRERLLYLTVGETEIFLGDAVLNEVSIRNTQFYDW